MRSITHYRGYAIITDESQGYIEVWQVGEAIQRVESVAEAKRDIDAWHDAR